MLKVEADDEMVWEDQNCQILYKGEKIADLESTLENQKITIDGLQDAKEASRTAMEF